MNFEKSDVETCLNFISRIHDRQMQFMYTGISEDPSLIVLGTHKESNFKFGNPEQGAALIKVTDEAILKAITDFFKAFKVSNDHVPMLTVSINAMTSLANKLKWDLTDLQVNEDVATGAIYASVGDENPVEIAHPIESYYTLLRLQQMLAVTHSGLLSETPSIVYPICPNKEAPKPVLSKVIPVESFKDTPLESKIVSPLKLLLRKGRDMLTVKKIVEKLEKDSYEQGLRIWCPGGEEICFGGYFKMDGYEILAGRLSLYVTTNHNRKNKDLSQ